MDSTRVTNHRPNKARPAMAAGVIGAGSFGTAVANRLIANVPVWLHVRTEQQKADFIRRQQSKAEDALAGDIQFCTSYEALLERCSTLFLLLPSQVFREVLREIAPLLRPHHRIIHGTKGLDVTWPDGANQQPLTRAHVRTMSEVLQEELPQTPFACMAGPNIAHQLNAGHPAATVIASPDTVLKSHARDLLQTDVLHVYFNEDILGLEWCGVLKNVIAIAAGCLQGLGYADNTRALLINRGLIEMATMGQALGAKLSPFLGLAGMGDLIATCTSTKSRNHTLGMHLAKGLTCEQALAAMGNVTVEGVRTTETLYRLKQHYGWEVPITSTLYQVLFEDLALPQAVQQLMRVRCTKDADFSCLD